MNTVPETASEAAKYIEKLAKNQKISIAQYCYARDVTPSIITKWRKLNKTYRVSTFLRLIKKA